MPKTPHTSPISPPPGQQDQSARLAASAQVGQVGGTLPLFLLTDVYRNPYQRWITVCDKQRSHFFVPRAMQARALIDWGYLA